MDVVISRSIFSPATGFILRGGFDWTCNPYLGCTFGCTYCYAAFLPQNRRPVEDWGKWFSAKRNAVELARKAAPKLAGQALYLSSVTDPYLPAEKTLRLTRGILEALLLHQPRLVIQTRGTLVTRDLELLKQFRSVRVNVSIPTDSDEVRLTFEPKAPRLEDRWAALAEARAAGVPVGLCVTPTLPLENPREFADRLVAAEPAVLVVQEFHSAGGKFGADTSERALRLAGDYEWDETAYLSFTDLLKSRREVFEGETGFFPPAKTISR